MTRTALVLATGALAWSCSQSDGPSRRQQQPFLTPSPERTTAPSPVGSFPVFSPPSGDPKPSSSVDAPDTAAPFLCSRCLKSHPREELHIIPRPSRALGRYVTSQRCETCWKATLAETRAHFAEHADAKELSAYFTAYKMPPAALTKYTAGKDQKTAWLAVLDAVAKGELVLRE